MVSARPASNSARAPRLAREVERMLTTVARLVDKAIDAPRPTDATLHELHRGLRRLRLGLELWADVLPTADRAGVHSLVRRTKRLARLVGEVRDRDVVLGLFDAIPRRAAGAAATGRYHRFLARLRDDSRTGRELLRASLRTERDAGLFVEGRAALARRPSPRAAGHLSHVIAAAGSGRIDRVRRAHKKATRRPTPERLHRLRIELRQFRHLNELIRLVTPEEPARVPIALRRLQDRLGRLHDLDVAVATIDPELDRSPWADRLRDERRRLRRGIRLDLERLSLPSVRPTPAGRPPRSGP